MTARICFMYSKIQKTRAKCFSVNKTLFIFSCLHRHVYCQQTLLERLVYENLSTAMVLNVIWEKGCQFLKIFLHTDHYAGNKVVEQWYTFGMKFGNKHWHKPLHWHCCSSETQDQSEATAWSWHEVPPKTKKIDITAHVHIVSIITFNSNNNKKLDNRIAFFFWQDSSLVILIT